MHSRGSGNQYIRQERDKEETTTHESRVERILTETAECHLSYANSHESADDNHPYREIGRKVHAKQKTCNDSGTIMQCRLALEESLADGPFKEQASGNAHKAYDGRSYSKEIARYQKSGQ